MSDIEIPTAVLYLDIDGTVRHGFDELGRFVNGSDDVVVFPEVPDLLAEYKARGWRIVGVSNQGGIALGHLTMAACVDAMIETQSQCRGAFDKILWCQHHPEASHQEMSRCWCRKPKAGLIFEAAHALRDKHVEIYPPYMALMAGDRAEDEGCADAADIDFLPAHVWRTGRHLRELP
jgi:D-glycero-D-manno-heptose 1,7-bisphosphate phosphatase